MAATASRRLIAAALLLLCRRRPDAAVSAFRRPPPRAPPLPSRADTAARRRGAVVVVAAARPAASGPYDDDEEYDARRDRDDDDDGAISRRDALGRAMRGVAGGLAMAASPTSVAAADGKDALETMIPGFLMASSEGTGGGGGGADRGVRGMPVPSKKLGGLTSKIRSVSRIMDELQRDLMQERWDLVEGYPSQLRSYVPVFTSYTDSAFPTDIPTDKGLRVALRYEVGRLFASLERFRSAASRRALDEAYVAYSDMSLHLDRYLRVGGLYTFYDDAVDLERYYGGVAESSLVYADPKKDPALVRDLIVLVRGPEKGRTGIVIGIYPDGSDTCAVKLDRRGGMREVRVVSRTWAAKRLGEQDPDDVFLIPQQGGG